MGGAGPAVLAPVFVAVAVVLAPPPKSEGPDVGAALAVVDGAAPAVLAAEAAGLAAVAPKSPPPVVDAAPPVCAPPKSPPPPVVLLAVVVAVGWLVDDDAACPLNSPAPNAEAEVVFAEGCAGALLAAAPVFCPRPENRFDPDAGGAELAGVSGFLPRLPKMLDVLPCCPPTAGVVLGLKSDDAAG